jgi:hypothetical protein
VAGDGWSSDKSAHLDDAALIHPTDTASVKNNGEPRFGGLRCAYPPYIDSITKPAIQRAFFMPG